MSYTSLRSGIETVLTDAGYTKLANELEITEAPEGREHKSFILKGTEIVERQISGSGNINVYIIELDVSYKNVNSTERDANFELFETLVESIHALLNFQGYTQNPTFTRMANHNFRSVAKLKFYYGIQGC